MTYMGDISNDAAIGVGVADAAGGLSGIHRPDCAAMLWQRPEPLGFQPWLDGLDPEKLPRARLILYPDAVRNAVVEICEISGTPETSLRDRLVDDVAALADTFAEVMQAPWLRLRFDVVTTNACRRFHIDAVTARLVCTYRGTGTQYGTSENGAEPERVFTVPTGSPIILRGTRWPACPQPGLLHRSPPIEGTGETRLVLVLDPVFEPENEI